MRVEDLLHFSPNFHTLDLELDNGEFLLEAFVDRVEGFYLEPASKLNLEMESFAQGLIVLSAIDFIGEFFIRTNNSHRIKKFCLGLDSLKDKPLKEALKITEIINNDYRNGLIHEGRIKNLGQFFTGIDSLIEIGEAYSMINPKIFLTETKTRFYEYVEIAKNSKDEMFHFKNRVKLRFKEEVDSLSD